LDSSKEEIKAARESHSAKDGKVAAKIGGVMPILNVTRAEAVGEVKKSEMPEGEKAAYRRLREARSEARLVGVREKRAKAKAEEAAAQKK
jgi:large subunit ribosomal protein L13e